MFNNALPAIEPSKTECETLNNLNRSVLPLTGLFNHEIPTIGPSKTEVDIFNNNLNKSVLPLTNRDNTTKAKTYSRQSLNDDDMKAIQKMHRWKAYEWAPMEQPFLMRCCPPQFFRMRYYSLGLFRKVIPMTNITFGKMIIFTFFLFFAGGVGYVMWGDATGSGTLNCLFLALTFAFPTRNSVWMALTGIPYERVLFWHKYVAILTLFMGIYHGLCAYELNISGLILISLIALIIFTSFYPFRKKAFECFYRIHWILTVFVIIIALAHGAALSMIGVVLWIFDVLIRVHVVRRNRRKVERAEITQIPPCLVKISFQRHNFYYKAGQYVFLCVPSLSIWEWHPFSISSSPNEDIVSLHARVLGDWTLRLYNLNKDHESGTSMWNIWIDGPYGNCSLDIDGKEYKTFLLISGGIGITPMQSICNQLIYEHLRGRAIKRIFFIWSVEDDFLIKEVTENTSSFYSKKLPSAKLQITFQPDVLVKHELGNVLESFFHLSTKKEADPDTTNINLRTQKLLKHGRPDLPSYFEQIKKVAIEQKENKVAVLCCGPQSMMDECRRLTRKCSDSGVRFDYHEETFDL